MLYFHVYFLKVNNKYRDGLVFSFSKWLVCLSLHGDVLLLFRRHEQECHLLHPDGLDCAHVNSPGEDDRDLCMRSSSWCGWTT